jgi:hypothetical protein
VWLDWHQAICPDNHLEIKTLEEDRGRYLGYVRMIGHRRPEAKLDEPIVSVTSKYSKQPFLREEEMAD